MTKHFSPEPGATELIGTDYIRAIDGAVMLMREDEPGSGRFVRHPRMSEKEILEDSKHNHRPVMSELESLEQAMAESPKNVSLKYVQTGLERLFKFSETHVSTIGKDRFTDGKRRVRKPGGCTSEASISPWRNLRLVLTGNKVASPRDASEPYYIDTFSLWHGNEDVIDIGLKPLPAGRPINRWRVNDAAVEDQPAGVEIVEASKSRARQEQYNIEHPENDSKIFPRKPRNASPTHEKPSLVLNALMEYRRLNASLEPLQTIYGKADGENYADDGEGEDDVAVCAADAELENRPSVEEMEARCANVVTMYPLTFLWLYIIVPVVHNIECIGYRKGIIPGLEDAARKSMASFWKRQATEPNPYWPEAKRKTKEQIGIWVDRIAKPERLNINDVDTSKPWSICRIGGLRFEPYGTQHRWRGQLTHYVDSKNPNRWHYAKEDVAGTPRGPEFFGSADQNDKDDMAKKGWKPFPIPRRKTTMVWLSDKEISEQWSNEDVPEPCLKEYQSRKRGPRVEPLPYYTPVEMLNPVYSFGSKYTQPDEPFDDVIERKSELDAVNAMLTSQSLRVANSLVLTDRTDSLARTYEGLGAMLCCSNVSKSTLIRLGKQSVQDTISELSVIYQTLTAP